jgi:hypothetical protein
MRIGWYAVMRDGADQGGAAIHTLYLSAGVTGLIIPSGFTMTLGRRGGIVMPTQVGIHVFPCRDQQRRGWRPSARHDDHH